MLPHIVSVRVLAESPPFGTVEMSLINGSITPKIDGSPVPDITIFQGQDDIRDKYRLLAADNRIDRAVCKLNLCGTADRNGGMGMKAYADP